MEDHPDEGDRRVAAGQVVAGDRGVVDVQVTVGVRGVVTGGADWGLFEGEVESEEGDVGVDIDVPVLDEWVELEKVEDDQERWVRGEAVGRRVAQVPGLEEVLEDHEEVGEVWGSLILGGNVLGSLDPVELVDVDLGAGVGVGEFSDRIPGVPDVDEGSLHAGRGLDDLRDGGEVGVGKLGVVVVVRAACADEDGDVDVVAVDHHLGGGAGEGLDRGVDGTLDRWLVVS